MRLRLSIDKVIMYLVSISLLTGSSCMWFLSMPMASIAGIKNVQYIFLTIFCLMGCFYNGKMRIKQRSILVLFFLVIYLLFYIVVTRSNPGAYLTKHVLIFIIFFLYAGTLIQDGKVDEFAKVFVNVVSIVASISLFFWLFGSLLGFIKGVSTPYIWAGNNHTTVNYFWLYFENIIQSTKILGRTVIRNTGIYAEAPGFSGYLIIALAIAIPAEKEKFPLWQKILLSITMFSTLSTKGIIAVMLLFALTYLFTNPSKSAQKFIFKCVFTIIIVAAVSIGIFYLLEDKSNTHSFLVRMDDVQAEITTWKEHVLFGAGYQETEEIVQNFTLDRGEGLSMGLTILLAQGGIYMIAFYALPLILALYTSSRIDKSLFMKVMIFGFMIVFNLLISSFHYDATTIFIIACGYAFACTAPLKHNYKAKIITN